MAYRIAPRLARVAARLRDDWGIDVIEVPGWESRGSGEHRDMLALVRHHTASPTGSSDAASLRVVTHGREGLRNSLSMWYQPRRGRRCYLVAAGVSWHAGRGGWRGRTSNTTAAGDEVENDGRGEPFTADQMYVTRAIETEMAREFGWPAGLTGAEHAEHAPGRKVDRYGIDGQTERDHVTQLLTQTTEEDDEMRTQLERGDTGWQVIDWMLQLQLASAIRGVDPKLGVDDDIAEGTYGGPSVAAVNRYRKALELTENGVYDAEVRRHVIHDLATPATSGPPLAELDARYAPREHPHAELDLDVQVTGTIR